MKRTVKQFLLTLFTAILFFSCSDSSTVMYKNVTGRAGELVVVISKDSWEGAPGQAIKDVLAQAQIGLPQEEPLFSLIDVPHQAFTDIFKTTRNIVQTRISSTVEKSGVTLKNDVWAYPQATVQINAKNQEEFVQLFNDNKDKIISYFLAAERRRNTLNYRNVYEKAVYNTLDKDFGITMRVPPGFRIMKQAKDFIWVQYDTPEIIQGIVIYTHPYVSDSAFTVNYQLPIRDSILKKYVDGPTDGSYMGTELRFDQIFNTTRLNGNYATEMRGLWRLYNDFMGGPYVALAVLDQANQQVINAYGFVYAPSKDKRNLLRQVEAMVYSLSLNNQADNDKLNKQADMEISVEG